MLLHTPAPRYVRTPDGNAKRVSGKIHVENFTFKFEFIVHLQTIKFIVKWDKKRNLFVFFLRFLFKNIFDTNSDSGGEIFLFIFSRIFRRGLHEKCEKCVDLGLGRGGGAREEGKTFIELYH